ncbi:MAG TPA: hypothetical protein VNH44_09205 [Micropepsaceae bacterium]|nr:hypothetical protein [Micropepsaceae bacterium]
MKMSRRRTVHLRSANDNKPQFPRFRCEVLLPQDLPVTQVEIEVFAALLDDWVGLAANDNEEISE